jgi:hypothetical protein
MATLERNPEAILHPEPLPGYVWLDTPTACST